MEIDVLQSRIKELERQLKQSQSIFDVQRTISHLPTDSEIKDRPDVLPEELDPLRQHGSHHRYYNWSLAFREIKPGFNQAYGSSSMFYYVERLISYVNTVSKQVTQSSCVPLLDLNSLTLRTLQNALVGQGTSSNHTQYPLKHLSRIQEEHLCSQYWAYIHPEHPILDIDVFREHFDFAWSQSRTTRHTSSLIDIVIALSLQLDAVLQASNGANDGVPTEPTDLTAGRWFYSQCQRLLQDQLEEPSVVTFQCYSLSVIWLSWASFQKAAHSLLAAGLRIGVILGLHVEPHDQLLASLREARKVLWWAMYSLEAQYAMDFGRPLAVHFSQATCTLPKYNLGEVTPTSEENIFRALNTQKIRLILATRAIYILFHSECAKILRQNNQTDLYQDLQDLETCAVWIDTKKNYLNAWLQQMPVYLQVRREKNGQSYSTDHTKLAVGRQSRQIVSYQMHLELLYHVSHMNIYRPFIAFSDKAIAQRSVTKVYAISCIDHAITISEIIYQDLLQDGMLRNSSQIWSWLLCAALAIAGYIVTSPESIKSRECHKAIEEALSSFDILTAIFPAAGTASAALRDLMAKMDAIQTPQTLGKEFQRGMVEQLSPQDGTVSRFKGSVLHDLATDAFIDGWTDSGYCFREFAGTEDTLTSEEWLNSLLDFDQVAGEGESLTDPR